VRFAPGLLSLLAAVPILAAVPAPPAKSPLPPPIAGETIDVSIVDFDAVVTDKHGNRVHGLSKDDFEVFEDGKPQAITHFAEYASSSPVREKRTIAIFIEPYPAPEFRVRPMYAAMKNAIRDLVKPGDSVIIETWQGSARIALKPTDDVKAATDLLDSIANAMIRAGSRAGKRYEPLEQGSFEPFSPMMLSPTDLDHPWPRHDVFTGLEGTTWPGSRPSSVSKQAMRGEVAAVNSLISAMSNESGRKLLLLMTQGLGPTEDTDYFYAVSGDHVPRWLGGAGSGNIFDAIKAAAAERNILVYSFPPGTAANYTDYRYIGFGPNPVIKGYLDRGVALRDLASATGGGYATSTDIPKVADRMRDDLTDYYSMAYRAEARRDNRMRKITVKAKNRDYSVRTRREYIEKNDDSRVRDQVVAAFFNSTAPSAIEVKAILGARRPAKRFSTIPVSVRIPSTAFMTSEDKGAFSIYIATSRGATMPSDITKRTIAFTTADLKQAEGGTLQYDFDLLTNPETNLLSIGVYDEVSHDSGYARVNLPREAR